MSGGKSNFRQGDLTKALKALAAAGKKVARVEVEDGKVVVIIQQNGEVETVNPWDEVLRR